MIIHNHPINGEEEIDVSAPAGTLAEFYRAFNRRNLKMMRGNWHQDECVLDNPLGGIRRGWAEIEPLYKRLFSGPARVYVEFFDYTLHAGDELFVAAGRERGHFENGGVRIELAIRTSRVYRKVAGRWKQIHHHGSIEDAGLLMRYQTAILSANNKGSSEKVSERDEMQGARSTATETYQVDRRGSEHRATQQIARAATYSEVPKE